MSGEQIIWGTIITVVGGIILNIFTGVFGFLYKLISKFASLLINKLRQVFHKVYKVFPSCIYNKNKTKDYIFIQTKHDGIVLSCDINTRLNPLKLGDIRKIRYDYYKEINNFDKGFKILDYNDVLCVSYTDEYIKKYIKEHYKKVKDQKTIDALYYDMTHKFYILNQEFDIIKHKKIF